MYLNALDLYSHRDVWSTTQNSKHSHWTPFVVPLGVHLRPSSCLHREAQICEEKGTLCHPHGPIWMFPRPLGFFTWHWIPPFQKLDQATKVLDLTHGTLDSMEGVFFTSCPTALAGQTDIDMSSYRSSGSRDSSPVPWPHLAPNTWLVFSHTRNFASLHQYNTGIWNIVAGKIGWGNKSLKSKSN